MDKKLKNAAGQIKMPEQLKEKIMDKCSQSKIKDNGGTEVTGVERIERKPISRTIAAIAACAVLLGGIGVTGHLLNRNGAPGDEIEESSEEMSEESIPEDDETGKWDFSSLDFTVRDLEKDTVIEKSDQLNAFISCFDWGKEKDRDIYSGYYDCSRPAVLFDFNLENDNPCDISIAYTLATPPEDGETGIARISHSAPDEEDPEGLYYAIDIDSLTCFLGDEELRQDFGMKNLWPDFAGTNFSINGWGTSVDADKMKLAEIGEVIDALEFTPLFTVPEEADMDSAEAWHLSSEQNELVLFPSGVAIYHKNIIGQDNSLTNIYNTYYTYDYETVSEILPAFSETNDQREIIMPDLIGMNHELAEDQLRQLGVNFETAYISSTEIQPGYIAETKPAANNLITPGDKVMIYITMNEDHIVPENYLGMTEEEAVVAAEYIGLEPVIERVPAFSDQGTVITQSVEEGMTVNPGAQIVLSVANGEAPQDSAGFSPFGTLCKMGCNINGTDFSDGDPTLKIVSDILYGWDWSNEQIIKNSEREKEAMLIYNITVPDINDGIRIIYIYDDGTIEWFDTQDPSAPGQIVHHYYADVDGDANPIAFNLHLALTRVSQIGEIDRTQ